MSRHHIGDILRFARNQQVLHGSVAFAEFARLAQASLSGSDFAYRVQGCLEDGKPFLLVRLEGSLQLQCQRCLEPMTWSCMRQQRYLLVPEGGDFPEEELEDDGYDAITVGETFDLPGLLEDEILLSLPFAPRHEACALPGSGRRTGEASPFAALAGLSKRE